MRLPVHKEEPMARTRTRFRRHQWRWYQRHWLLSILVVLVVSGAGWWSWEQYSGQQQRRAAEGARAPAFTLPSHTGSAVALASYLGRQPVVLIFYMGDF
jgi:hypothetical protein